MLGVLKAIRKMGYLDLVKEKASEKYRAGKTTLSQAARQAGLTLWEMERYLVEQGYKSSYSIEDLESELRSLR